MSPKKAKAWWMKTNKPAPKQSSRIDERLEIPGFGAMTRRGRFITMESNRTGAEQKALTERLAAQHQTVVREIQSCVATCASIIPRHDPLELLHRAYTDFFAAMLGKAGEHELGFSNLVDVRMLDYVQTLIVALPANSEKIALEEHQWKELRTNVEKLYDLLLTVWPSTEGAARRRAGNEDEQRDRFLVPLLLDWLSVRGSRYPVHERERAASLLAPHESELVKLFGVGSDAIACAIEQVVHRLTMGMSDAGRVLMEIHKDIFSDKNLASFAPRTGLSEKEELDALVEHSGRSTELQKALGQAFGRDLFDITELLPEPLLRCLSLSPGADTSFYAPGEFQGWPVRSPPTGRRPILEVGGRFYIFDRFSTDPLYRAIQRAVFAADPSYKTTWNDAQKRVTEQLPIDLLRPLIPGARVFRDVFYPAKDGNKTKWCECDAIIVLDDMMLVIEVKAGRATELSPLEDLAAHAQTVEALLISPSEQADRFVRHFESASEVTIYDSLRTEIATLRQRDVELCVRCAITADSLASIAGSFQHIEFLTSGRALPTTWCLSIDDLYAYRDVLQGPVDLYHFLKQRLAACALPELATMDELDHLGVYLHVNAYVEWVKTLGGDMVTLHGYRASLDAFFAQVWSGGSSAQRAPSQKLPTILRQIIEALERRAAPGFLRAGAAILDLDASSRDSLAAMILAAGEDLGSSPNGRIVMMAAKGHRLFVSLVADELTSSVRRINREHAAAQLAVSDADKGVLIHFARAAGGAADSAVCDMLDLEEVEHDELERLRALGALIGRSRFQRARSDGVKIGRNQQCLCGSGLKYKKCCL